MWFGTLVVKNLIRRPMRSALTVIAIGIAICAVVSLVGIASGFEETFRNIYKRKGVDLIVARAGGAGQGTSATVPLSLNEKIKSIPGVKDSIAALVDVVSVGDIPSVVCQGWIPETVVFDHMKVLEGRMMNKYDVGEQRGVMLGIVLARNLDKKVGDKLEILPGGPLFEVIGIHESNNVFENGALVIALSELQELMDKKDKVTAYSVILDPEMKTSDPELIPTVRKQIEALDKTITAVPAQEFVKGLKELQIVKAMAWITSTIALVIGLFGVMNTMVMAVSERTREIGILRAVGWRPKRVLQLVLLEAVVLSMIGAVIGIVSSVLLVRGLTNVKAVAGLIDSTINPIYFVYGLVIAFVVGLIGGILPARRAARMLPTAALRQE